MNGKHSHTLIGGKHKHSQTINALKKDNQKESHKVLSTKESKETYEMMPKHSLGKEYRAKWVYFKKFKAPNKSNLTDGIRN